jgi:hypothetical protein
MGAKNWGEPQRSNGDTNAISNAGSGALDLSDRTAPIACWAFGSIFGWSGDRAFTAAVDFNTAANNDAFECSALGRRSENRCSGLVGQFCSNLGRSAGVGFPYTNVDQDMRVEFGDRVHDAIVVVWVDAVKRRTLETSSWRICVDPGE